MKRKRSAITKAKMLQGIKDILVSEGCGKVNVAYISTQSGIDRKLLYYHFGSFQKMVSEFLQLECTQFLVSPEETKTDGEAMSALVRTRMEALENNPLLSQLMVWGLSEKIPALKEYTQKNAAVENELARKLAQQSMQNGDGVDHQAVLALLLGGIHYLSAYAHQNRKPFFSLDMHDESHKKHLLDALDRLFNSLKR